MEDKQCQNLLWRLKYDIIQYNRYKKKKKKKKKNIATFTSPCICTVMECTVHSQPLGLYQCPLSWRGPWLFCLFPFALMLFFSGRRSVKTGSCSVCWYDHVRVGSPFVRQEFFHPSFSLFLGYVRPVVDVYQMVPECIGEFEIPFVSNCTTPFNLFPVHNVIKHFDACLSLSTKLLTSRYGWHFQSYCLSNLLEPFRVVWV